MRTKLVLLLTLIVALVVGVLFARQVLLSRGLPHDRFAEHTLRILTYSTFISADGPGTAIFNRFEVKHDCRIQVDSVADSGLLLARLKLAQKGVPYDVVIGLDPLLLEHADPSLKWKSLNYGTEDWYDEAVAFKDSRFQPLDWSPLTFIYRNDETKKIPKTFADLLRPEFSHAFALQDPRASSPGLQFLRWVKTLEGDQTVDWLKKFQPNVNSVSASWAFSYGLFKNEKTPFVFSYLTSLAYHWSREKNQHYRAVRFPEGHPVQVELAAIPDNCHECALANDLLEALRGTEAQKTLMEKNFMFPVVKGLEKGTVFSKLPHLKTLTLKSDGNDLHDWDQVFAR